MSRLTSFARGSVHSTRTFYHPAKDGTETPSSIPRRHQIFSSGRPWRRRNRPKTPDVAKRLKGTTSPFSADSHFNNPRFLFAKKHKAGHTHQGNLAPFITNSLTRVSPPKGIDLSKVEEHHALTGENYVARISRSEDALGADSQG